VAVSAAGALGVAGCAVLFLSAGLGRFFATTGLAAAFGLALALTAFALAFAVEPAAAGVVAPAPDVAVPDVAPSDVAPFDVAEFVLPFAAADLSVDASPAAGVVVPPFAVRASGAVFRMSRVGVVMVISPPVVAPLAKSGTSSGIVGLKFSA
jgi:hypothetical protein